MSTLWVWPVRSLYLDFQVKFKLTTTLFCINRHMCRNAVGDGLVLEILLHFSSSIHSMLDWSLTMNWKCKPFFLLTCHSWRFVPTRPVWNDTITKLKPFFWAKIWNVVSIQHLTPMKILGAWTSKLRTNNRPFWQEFVCVPLWTLRQIIIMAWNQDPVITQGSNDIKMKALSIYKW